MQNEGGAAQGAQMQRDHRRWLCPSNPRNGGNTSACFCAAEFGSVCGAPLLRTGRGTVRISSHFPTWSKMGTPQPSGLHYPLVRRPVHLHDSTWLITQDTLVMRVRRLCGCKWIPATAWPFQTVVLSLYLLLQLCTAGISLVLVNGTKFSAKRCKSEVLGLQNGRMRTQDLAFPFHILTCLSA